MIYGKSIAADMSFCFRILMYVRATRTTKVYHAWIACYYHQFLILHLLIQALFCTNTRVD